MVVIPSLEGLDDRFQSGGAFLDVGVGVGAVDRGVLRGAPDTLWVVGIDVLHRALDLARNTLATAGCAERVELRLQAVEELNDTDRFDLAWLPSPFMASQVIATAVDRMHAALHPGGWIVVAARPFDQERLASAVTRWKTYRAGGTVLPRDDATRLLEGAGFVDIHDIPTPPGAPALFAGRRP